MHMVKKFFHKFTDVYVCRSKGYEWEKSKGYVMELKLRHF